MVGQTLAHYRLLELVGRGGMASVFRALDTKLDREVAVKLLHPHLSAEKEARLRFAREAKAVARLRHENILEIYAYSDEGEQDSYLVTELLGGPNLRALLLRHRPRFPEVAALIGIEVTAALQAAHAQGVIHRDVKPENIMVRAGGTLVLCDFGIARILDKDSVTATGQLLGSPAYIAPEHIRGEPQDGRSDLFSLGVVLYEVVTGELPFCGKNPHETLSKIGSGVHTPVDELSPLCSPELAQLIERCLRTSPEQRYPDAASLLEALHAVLRDAGIRDPRAELRAFLQDPQAWEAAYEARWLAALLARGDALRAAGRVAAALKVWARAQRVAPEDVQLRDRIQSVARRQRLRRAGLWSGGVAASVLLVSGGVWLIRPLRPGRPRPPPPIWAAPSVPEREPGRDPGREARDPPGPPTAGLSTGASSRPAGAGEPTSVEPPPRPLRRHTPGRPVGGTPVAPAGTATAPRVVRLEPWPKAVAVTHNGRRLGDYGVDVRTVQLGPGTNEFVFENPACFSERVVLPPDSSAEEVRVRLRWKPALLQVRAESPRLPEGDSGQLGVDVLVEGRLVGRAGQVLAVPLPPLSDDGQATVKVQVSAPLHQSVTRTVTLRANQLSSLAVTLVPR
ncbi:MAG: protein kinase [Polyangia bacterium]